jgi:hypothetical protein
VLCEEETGGEVAPSLASFNVAKDATIGHDNAMESAQGVFRLAAAFVLRLASNSCLSCSGMLCLRALLLAFISCLFMGAIFCLLPLCCVFLSSSDLFCRAILLLALISFFCSAVSVLLRRAALLRAFISSLCSVVKLFRWALSRSRLAQFLSSELFAIGRLWSAITVSELPVTSFTCLLSVLCTTFFRDE